MKFNVGDQCKWFCKDTGKLHEFTIKEIFLDHHPRQSGWEGSDWCLTNENDDEYCLQDIELVKACSDKYYLAYTEDCDPKLKEFNQEKDLHRFMAEFGMTIHNNPDNFMDYVFKGQMTMNAGYIKLEKAK